MPVYCRCGKPFRQGTSAYCVRCGFETRADGAPKAEPNATPSVISDAELRSPGERIALLTGLALFAASWIAFDVATDALPLLIVSALVIVYAVYQQGEVRRSGIAVGARSFPEVDTLARNAALRLGIEKPNLFIRRSAEMNAFAMGFWGTSCVVLNSTTVHSLYNDPRELQFIIGHEFTHVRCSHVLWQTLAANNPILGRIPVLNLVLSLFFSWWSRQAEFTADRGGLIACGDLAASRRALARLIVGPELLERLNLDEFVKQSREGDLSARAGEVFSSHPALAKRMLALTEFAQGPLGDYARRDYARAAST